MSGSTHRTGDGGAGPAELRADSWADPDLATLLGSALDRRPPADGDAGLVTCRAQPDFNDAAYEFVFFYDSGPSVGVEVRLDLGCQGIGRPEWAFVASNGTIRGRFALTGTAADALRDIVMGPKG